MKAITERQLYDIIADILNKEEKKSEKAGIPFTGLANEDLNALIEERVGGEWVLKKEQAFKLTKSDINAIANNRYYRRTGVKILMGAVIILLALSIMANNLQFLPPAVFYGLCGASAIALVYLYSSGQAKTRKSLWRAIGRDETEEI